MRSSFIAHPSSPNLTRYWLLLGVFALAVAGLYSLTLVIGRAPGLSDNPEIQRIFKDALVVHVDLSVLVWFLAIACMFWSLATQQAKPLIPYLEEAALICFGLCILFMMASPLDPKAVAYMSNYIPVISTPIFYVSLSFLLCGVGFMLVRHTGASRHPDNVKALDPDFRRDDGVFRFALSTAALITLITLACFVWSYLLMPSVIEGEQYFELLFWGGGHVLQFTHTQFLMLVWILLLNHICKTTILNRPKFVKALFSIGIIAALISPIAYFLYEVTSSEFRNFFTHKMIAIGGIAPGILGVIVLVQLIKHHEARKSEQRALWSCLFVSTSLFLYGGFLGLLIQGQNVVIPAHYHGSIVGITLAFMGFAYYMLPQLGYRAVAGWRMAYLQPIIYGLGQVMHVSGLAYSGGYGVLRKTAGGTGELAMNVKVALGFMGLGGLLAIIGGLLFVVVVVRAVIPAKAGIHSL